MTGQKWTVQRNETEQSRKSGRSSAKLGGYIHLTGPSIFSVFGLISLVYERSLSLPRTVHFDSRSTILDLTHPGFPNERLTINFRRKTFSFINEKVGGKLVPIPIANYVGYSQQKLKKVAMNILDGLNLSKTNGHEIEQLQLPQLNNQSIHCIFVYLISYNSARIHCI